jgi:hypothetical protein
MNRKEQEKEEALCLRMARKRQLDKIKMTDKDKSAYQEYLQEMKSIKDRIYKNGGLFNLTKGNRFKEKRDAAVILQARDAYNSRRINLQGEELLDENDIVKDKPNKLTKRQKVLAAKMRRYAWKKRSKLKKKMIKK